MEPRPLHHLAREVIGAEQILTPTQRIHALWARTETALALRMRLPAFLAIPGHTVHLLDSLLRLAFVAQAFIASGHPIPVRQPKGFRAATSAAVFLGTDLVALHITMLPMELPSAPRLESLLSLLRRLLETFAQ